MPGTDTDDDPADTIHRIVDDALRPLSTPEVAEKSGYSKPTALKYLKHLHANGDIEREERGNTYYWYTGDKALF